VQIQMSERFSPRFGGPEAEPSANLPFEAVRHA